MIVWLLAAMPVMVAAEKYLPYESVILSSEPLASPISGVQLLEDSDEIGRRIVLLSIVKGMPKMEDVAPNGNYFVDTDDCVDMAITYETIRRRKGLQVVNQSSNNVTFEPGPWLLDSSDDKIVYSDIMNRMVKDAPDGIPANIILTTCPIWVPVRVCGDKVELVEEEVHQPCGGDSFKVLDMKTALFAPLVIVTIVSVLG